MKILHTSDWHLGNRFYHWDRTDEFEHFFEQLLENVRAECPDVLIVAGDIFDVPTPGIVASEMWVDILRRLIEEAPRMMIMVIAGNHDSGSRLALNDPLLRDNLVFVGRDPRVTDVAGVRFVLQPYVGQRVITGGRPDVEAAVREYFERLLGVWDGPAVIVTHLPVTEYGTDEPMFSYPARIFGNRINYVALGHIHRAHEYVYGTASTSHPTVVRFCGSPLPMSFDDISAKTLSVVQISEDGETHVREVPIPPLRSVLTLPAPGTEAPDTPKALLKLLKVIDTGTPQYLRMRLRCSDGVPTGVQEDIRSSLRDTAVRFCYVQPERTNTPEIERKKPVYSLEDIRRQSPVDLALDTYRRIYRQDMPDSMQELLRQAIDEALNNQQ